MSVFVVFDREDKESYKVTNLRLTNLTVKHVAMVEITDCSFRMFPLIARSFDYNRELKPSNHS